MKIIIFTVLVITLTALSVLGHSFSANNRLITSFIEGVNGSGTPTYLPKFLSSTTLTDSHISDDGQHLFLDSGTGVLMMGDLQGAGHETNIFLDDALRLIYINSGTGTVSLGDTTERGNSSFITVDDADSIIYLNAININLGTTDKLFLKRTIAVTSGNQTINKPNGTVNFATSATDITVTNSTVNANSLIYPAPQRFDATCQVFIVDQKTTGSFHIKTPVGCTSETPVAFWVTN